MTHAPPADRPIIYVTSEASGRLIGLDPEPNEADA